jgi:transposase
MRSIGLDVHQSFCQVAIHADGETRSAGRIATDRAELELFAQSLDPTDQVVLEATGPAFEIARVLRPHVARVVVVNAAEVRAISHAKVKSDRFDARTLARLLDAGMLDSVWVPSAEIAALRRRVARRGALVRQRTRAKNEIHAALARCLLGRPPVSDLFGSAGRSWLADRELPPEEVRDRERLPAPDRLLRCRGRGDRREALRVGQRLCGGQAADDDSRNRGGRRRLADGGDRRRLAL